MACVSVDNVTTPPQSAANLTDLEELYVTSRYHLYHIVLPVIFIVGMLGNTVNLVMFISRCQIKMEQLEKSSMCGLISLAVSDFCFCLVGFPAVIFPESVIYIETASVKSIVGFYYNTYNGALFNLFLFTSTWLVVAISVERYIAVCHMLHARHIIHVKKTALVHVCIFLVGIIVCIPEFLKQSVGSIPCAEGCTCLYVAPAEFFSDNHFSIAYHILWSSVGTYIPLIVLLFTNINLISALLVHRSLSITDPSRYACTRITKTVVGIVLSFVVLVCPSMLLQSVLFYEPYQSTALSITMLYCNLLQAIKFSSNFLLYLVVNRQFRDNVKRFFKRNQLSPAKYITSEQTRPTLDMEMV